MCASESFFILQVLIKFSSLLLIFHFPTSVHSENTKDLIYFPLHIRYFCSCCSSKLYCIFLRFIFYPKILFDFLERYSPLWYLCFLCSPFITDVCLFICLFIYLFLCCYCNFCDILVYEPLYLKVNKFCLFFDCSFIHL